MAHDPVLGRLFRENAVRCRRLAENASSSALTQELEVLAAEYEYRAAEEEFGGRPEGNQALSRC
jgi:hypothetical protein